jgi:hypothetical protein
MSIEGKFDASLGSPETPQEPQVRALIKKASNAICHSTESDDGKSCREKYGVDSWCTACVQHALVAVIAPTETPQEAAPPPVTFTEHEIRDVLTSLYQDGHVDLVLADRVAALMQPPSLLAAPEGRVREALEDMVYQFGYYTVKDGQPAIGTGGLSALEEAFEVLGWDDPYVIPDPVWCDAPVTPRCPNRPTSGTPTPDGYKHFCHEHFSYWQNGAALAPLSRRGHC